MYNLKTMFTFVSLARLKLVSQVGSALELDAPEFEPWSHYFPGG